VEVEDPLGDALIRILRRDEQREHDGEAEQAGGRERENREVIP